MIETLSERSWLTSPAAPGQLSGDMEQLQRKADFVGSNAGTMLRPGEHVREIVRAPEEWAADLIVIGSARSEPEQHGGAYRFRSRGGR